MQLSETLILLPKIPLFVNFNHNLNFRALLQKFDFPLKDFQQRAWF